MFSNTNKERCIEHALHMMQLAEIAAAELWHVLQVKGPLLLADSDGKVEVGPAFLEE